MRKYAPANNLIITLLLIIVVTAFIPPATNISLTGAWHSSTITREESITLTDGYFVYAAFDKAGKQFLHTWGGPFTVEDGTILVTTEFNTQACMAPGAIVAIPFSGENDSLVVTMQRQSQLWKRVDKGLGDLAGVWRIAGRKKGAQPVTIPLAPQRTLKVLSGTRFQWVAINTATNEFFGTGGGTYTFRNGKYTENIEFFSQDSSRVGLSLIFRGKVQAGKEWDHSGQSAAGEPVDEMWRKLKTELARN